MTTTRITHATPAAGFASTPFRDWEANLGDEGVEEKQNQGCRDIAYQLVHGETGKNINVSISIEEEEVEDFILYIKC